MFFCQRITQSGKIVIFVYQTDIDAFRTWMTVFAVSAFSLGLIRGQGADDRIVSLFFPPVLFRFPEDCGMTARKVDIINSMIQRITDVLYSLNHTSGQSFPANFIRIFGKAIFCTLCLSDHPIIFSIKIPYPFVGSLTNT